MLVLRPNSSMAEKKKYPKRSTPESRAFGRLIAEARGALDLTQDEVAEQLTGRLGRIVQRGYVGNLELGLNQNPGRDVLEALESILHVSRVAMLQRFGLLPEDMRLQESFLMDLRRLAALSREQRDAAIDAYPPDVQEALRQVSVVWFDRATRLAEE